MIAVDDADAVAGIAGHTNSNGCFVNGNAYSACAQYDSLYQTHVVLATNALNQSSSMSYTGSGGPAASNGWGQWITSKTDANGQSNSYTYDPLGRLTAVSLPGETGPWTSQYAYTITCPATGAAQPCVGLAQTQRLDSSGTTVTSATYYDGWGRPVETVSPAPNSGSQYQYDVQYTIYDTSGRVAFASEPYLVTATCTSGTPPYFAPNTSSTTGPAGTSYTYDGLGRVLTMKDPAGNTTTTSYRHELPQGANVNDTDPYEETIVTDPNGHQSINLTDGFGRTAYAETFSGNGTTQHPYVLYAMSAYQYDYLGDTTSITGPNLGSAGISASPQMTASYDLLGRETGMSDADLGQQWSYSYDPDGNLTKSVDPRGASGTVYIGYDGLDRPLWRNTSNSSVSAYATYSYDNTANGNQGIGHLTGETFNQGSAGTLSGSYSYTYDNRGQDTGWTLNANGTNFNLKFGYNDAGQQTSLTYSDGEVLTYGFNSAAWLTSAVTTPSGGSSINLMTGITYSGAGGAASLPTAATMANGTYSYSANYDNDLRLSSMSIATGGTTLFGTTRSYDAAGNTTSAATQLAAGSDNQVFCYDEQDRLTWAGSVGTPTCSQTAIAAGTLTSAQYQQSFAYDTLDRLTSVTGSGAQTSQGTYTYGDSAQLHAATSTSGGFSASYDAAGDMTCRAADSSSGTCSGSTATGATLSYDAERQLTSWQSPSNSPTRSVATFLYDGEGNRVIQTNSRVGRGATTTVYIGNLEEYETGAGMAPRLTKYYPVAGLSTAMNVNGTISYLAADGLGSVSEALSGSGTVVAAQLFAPYGGQRYSSGQMPTTYGFTGQQGDPTGLDYYGARYYDPALGQFTSADTVLDGLNRFAYVGDSPESRIDPTGQDWFSGAWNTVQQGFGQLWSSFQQDPVGTTLDLLTGYKSMQRDIHTLQDDKATTNQKAIAGADLLFNVVLDASTVGRVGHVLLDGLEHLGEDAAVHTLEHAVDGDTTHTTGGPETHANGDIHTGGSTSTPGDGDPRPGTDSGGDTGGGCSGGGLSFSADTLVATPTGEQAISSLIVGDRVEAYDPATGKTSSQTVEYVFINHDTDLLDVTLRRVAEAGSSDEHQSVHAGRIEQHSATSTYEKAASAAEIIHTTANHPWLTADRGWEQAGALQVGEHVRGANGINAVVMALHAVQGSAYMWDVTVDQVHTFLVGTGGYVVHNCDPKAAGMADLAQRRAQDGVPPPEPGKNGACGRLDINGTSYYGRSGKHPYIQLGTNAVTRDHAEGEAFWNAYQAGERGGHATFYVDQPVCGYCGGGSGLIKLARALQLDSLVVYDPLGVRIIIP